jgi:hypothetical protein
LLLLYEPLISRCTEGKKKKTIIVEFVFKPCKKIKTGSYKKKQKENYRSILSPTLTPKHIKRDILSSFLLYFLSYLLRTLGEQRRVLWGLFAERKRLILFSIIPQGLEASGK